MACFVLIHGSMHGGWCWQELVRELERGTHAGGVGDPLARDVVRRAVVDARANDRKTEGPVDAAAHGVACCPHLRPTTYIQALQRCEPLVVVHRHHEIDRTGDGHPKRGLAGHRTPGLDPVRPGGIGTLNL